MKKIPRLQRGGGDDQIFPVSDRPQPVGVETSLLPRESFFCCRDPSIAKFASFSSSFTISSHFHPPSDNMLCICEVGWCQKCASFSLCHPFDGCKLPRSEDCCYFSQIWLCPWLPNPLMCLGLLQFSWWENLGDDERLPNVTAGECNHFGSGVGNLLVRGCS